MKALPKARISFVQLDHNRHDAVDTVKPGAAERCEAGLTMAAASCSLWQAERINNGKLTKKECPET